MEVNSWIRVSEVTSGVAFTVGLWTGVVEVFQWGGRQGSEVRTVVAGWVELSVVGKSSTGVVSVGDSGGTVGFVVAGGPVDMVDVSGTSGGLEVVLQVSAVGTAADQEVLSA